MSVRIIRRCVAAGIVLEVAALFSAIPKDSLQPATTWQNVAQFTQIPGILVFRVIAGLFGHSLDLLPSPIGTAGAFLIFAIAGIAQVAVFSLVVWLVSNRVWHQKTEAPIAK